MNETAAGTSPPPALVVEAQLDLTTDDCRFLDIVLPHEPVREIGDVIAEHFGIELPDAYTAHDFRFPGRYEVTIRRLDE